MDCRSFNRKLEDYLQGGLDFPGRFGMERHARQCFACGKTVEDAQKLGRMARNLGRVRAPASFEADLLGRIRREGLARRRGGFLRLPLFWSDWLPWRTVAFGTLAIGLLVAGILVSGRWINVEPDGSIRWARKEPVREQAPQINRETNPSVPVESSDGSEVSEQAGIRQAGVVFPTQESGLSIYAEPATDTNYVDYLVPGPGDRQMIMRLPKTIWMRYGQPSEEYYIRNVSH